MVYYESPQATVSWDDAVKAVIVQWKGFVQSDAYRTPYEKGLELLVQKNAQKWLIDSRKLSVVSQDDQEWMAKDFHVRNMAAGMKYVALVKAEKVTARSSARRMISAAQSVAGFCLEEFDSVDEAMQWLTEVE